MGAAWFATIFRPHPEGCVRAGFGQCARWHGQARLGNGAALHAPGHKISDILGILLLEKVGWGRDNRDLAT